MDKMARTVCSGTPGLPRLVEGRESERLPCSMVAVRWVGANPPLSAPSDRSLRLTGDGSVTRTSGWPPLSEELPPHHRANEHQSCSPDHDAKPTRLASDPGGPVPDLPSSELKQ